MLTLLLFTVELLRLGKLIAQSRNCWYMVNQPLNPFLRSTPALFIPAPDSTQALPTLSFILTQTVVLGYIHLSTWLLSFSPGSYVIQFNSMMSSIKDTKYSALSFLETKLSSPK